MPRHAGPTASPSFVAIAYAAIRTGGAPPRIARTQLDLDETEARRVERLFRARAARGAGDSQLPKFARHDRHVAAVKAEGGFPVLPERCGRR